MLKVKLNPREELNILKGFSWVYNNEVAEFSGDIKNGEVVKVCSYDDKFVGYGFLSLDSKLLVRMLTLKEDEVIDRNFFKKRIEYAIQHRQNLGFESCRLIFAEADFLPGLIVDRYGDYLCVQFLCLGMDKIKSMIVDILVELLDPKGIYERSDMPVRLKEGLPLVKGYLYSQTKENFSTVITTTDNDIKLYVDLKDGQKTGYFLDQRLNREILKYYVKDKVVLDAFSNIGGFALTACKYGAKFVDACDISQRACQTIEDNAKLNGYNGIRAICVDVFDYLHDAEIVDKYDVIILDPPAFTKEKTTVKRAYRGYKEINLQALKIIKSGGYLLTFSCSQNMTPDLFKQMLNEAVVDSGRQVQFLDFRIQSPDHPALLTSSEQLYLKCIILRVK